MKSELTLPTHYTDIEKTFVVLLSQKVLEKFWPGLSLKSKIFDLVAFVLSEFFKGE